MHIKHLFKDTLRIFHNFCALHAKSLNTLLRLYRLAPEPDDSADEDERALGDAVVTTEMRGRARKLLCLFGSNQGTCEGLANEACAAAVRCGTRLGR